MKLIDEFISKFERDIYKSFGQKKDGSWLTGTTRIQEAPTDKREIREMSLAHNHKVRF